MRDVDVVAVARAEAEALTAIREASDEMRRFLRYAETARRARDDAIREAMAAGGARWRIAVAAGVTPAMLYKIVGVTPSLV